MLSASHAMLSGTIVSIATSTVLFQTINSTANVLLNASPRPQLSRGIRSLCRQFSVSGARLEMDYAPFGGWLLGKKKSENGFDKSSTAEEVTQGVDATGLTALVTGCTSGNGKETVRVLAKRGAHVILAGRNTESASKVKEAILQETPNAKVNIIKLDTSSLESVRRAAEEFLTLNLPLNVLVNNAGIAFIPFDLSVDGIELHFAANYLGHFLLTMLLLDKMKETAKESGIEGRIVNVSSLTHGITYKEGIRFESLNDKKGYGKIKSYGQSKLAVFLFTKELAKRLQEEGANITVNCLHPGVCRTNIWRKSDIADTRGLINFFYRLDNHLPFDIGSLLPLKTSDKGAAPQCYLALNPTVKGVTGKYFYSDVNERESLSKFVRDEELAKKLWDFSVKLTSQSTR